MVRLGAGNALASAPTTAVLVIAASNGFNLELAERFAAAARAQGQSAEVLDLTAIALPLFTPRAQAAGAPAAQADLQAQLSAAPRWVIYSAAIRRLSVALWRFAETRGSRRSTRNRA